MANNVPRWNWLMQGTYNLLTPEQKGLVCDLFDRKQNEIARADIALYETMIELGIKIKGTDPSPPPKPPLVTQAGVEEYDQIMTDLDHLGL